MKNRSKRIMAAGLLFGGMAVATAASAEVPNLMHHTNGHEAVYKNSCLVAFDRDGNCFENTEVRSEKQINTAKGLIVVHLAAHNGTRHTGTVKHVGASVNRVSDGSFEVS